MNTYGNPDRYPQPEGSSVPLPSEFAPDIPFTRQDEIDDGTALQTSYPLQPKPFLDGYDRPSTYVEPPVQTPPPHSRSIENPGEEQGPTSNVAWYMNLPGQRDAQPGIPGQNG